MKFAFATLAAATLAACGYADTDDDTAIDTTTDTTVYEGEDYDPATRENVPLEYEGPPPEDEVTNRLSNVIE